jgi:signal transduction histidine kinase
MPENPHQEPPSQDVLEGRPIRSALASFGIRAAVAFSVPLAAGLVFLAAEDAFEVRSSLAASLVALAALAIIAMFAMGLRDLRRAEERAEAALERAHAAEKVERSRGDHLARVLQASQGLHLAGEGRVDYRDVLAAITPAGATSFLVRTGSGGGRVETAHGPLAPAVMAAQVPAGHGQDGAPEPDDLTSILTFSVRGRAVGPGLPAGHLDDLVAPIESGIAIPLIAHDGLKMGTLHLIDPDDERVLDPSFVGLAQLVANQIAVAMENDDLLVHLRRQLAEVQRVQQQLIQASKLGAIGELAAAVAHEVNNPLTGILGFAELLLVEMPPGDARRAEVTVIHDEAMRARSIIRSLLDFARPRTPQRIASDLTALAESAIDLVRYRAQETHIHIDEDFGPLPSIQIDPDSFKQVLLNLYTNAIEAMPDGGTLSISTRAADGKVAIVVADSGIGIDRATRDRIFTPFFSARTRGGYGTGLGLSVSLNIVQGHGGTIEVQSEPGHGSAFTVWLPVTPPSHEESPSGAGRATVPSTGAEVAA